MAKKNKKNPMMTEAVKKATGIGEKHTGTVKWFNLQKGFGFITDENGNDHFVHHRGIVTGRHFTGFHEGDEVSFEIVQGKTGPQAGSVVLTSPISDEADSKPCDETTEEEPATEQQEAE